MSLHHLAQHMQSAGRGEDKVLVHMTPKEVQGLQSLAMSHGGSLTINPQTGLPEAGFLSSILPMIAGFALAPFTGGMSAAMLVGGGTALATGSLQKGLMAGLGAFGGAGLGSSLAGLGAGAAEAGAGAAGTLGGAGSTAANLGAQGSAFGTNLAASGTALPGTINAGVASGMGLPNLAQTAAMGPFAGTGITAASSPAITAASQITPMVSAVPQFVPSAAYAGAEPTVSSITGLAPTPTYANMGQGFDKLNSLDALKTFGKDNMMNIGMAAAPMLMPDKFNPPKQDQGMIRPYTFSRTQNPQAYAQDAQGRTNTPVYGQPFDSSERQYFNDQYTAGTPYAAPGPEYKAATGGLTALAVGGPVEAMAAQNAVGDNTMYPQAGLQAPMYSNPQVQRPVSTNVVSPSGDVNVDPYTGEQKFADGGSTTQNYAFNPQTQQFTRQNQVAAPITKAGNGFGLFAKMAEQVAAQQAPVGSTVSGGVATPYMQQAQQTPQYVDYQQAPQMQQPMQRPDNMQGFYDYMQNQMTGMQGSQGYAGGGSLGTGMASYGGNQKNIRTNQDVHAQNIASGSKDKLLATQQAAKYGDFAAYKALQDAGYDMQDASNFAAGGMTDGHLGGYSDGGRLLRGPGDGVSDDIPASIGDKQPARLADGEFVVPARIVSELGNGSTEAGARQLYKMMERVQHNRRKSVGKDKVAVDAKSSKFLPA